MDRRTVTGTTETTFTYVGNLMDTATGGESFDLGYDRNGNVTTGVTAGPIYNYNWDNKMRKFNSKTVAVPNIIREIWWVWWRGSRLWRIHVGSRVVQELNVP
jgi:hypothetical protein